MTAHADALKDRGVQQYQQHDYENAASTFAEAQDAYSAAGDTLMAAEMKVNQGLALRALNEADRALAVMREALAVFETVGDALRQAQALGNMGGTYLKLDDKEQAYTCYRRAADLFEALGERAMYGETLLAIADMQVKDGKVMAGAATYEVGLENLERLSPSQRVIKGLLGVRSRLSGGGKAK